MNKLNHIIYKIMSGRWLLTVTAAGVFAYLACTGLMEPKDVQTLIGIIFAFYFGQRSGGNGGRHA